MVIVGAQGCASAHAKPGIALSELASLQPGYEPRFNIVDDAACDSENDKLEPLAADVVYSGDGEHELADEITQSLNDHCFPLVRRLLRGAPLSEDAVSRLVGRLREVFEAWAKRDLSELKVRYIFLDGWYPRVRIGKKRVRVPVLVTLGGAPMVNAWCWTCGCRGWRASRPGWTRCGRWPGAIWVPRSWR